VEIVVFGATGRTGRAVTLRALDRGHGVTAFVRSPDRLGGLEHERLRVVRGNALDAVSVASVLEEAEAAISAIGAPSLEPTTDLSRATGHLIDAMTREGPGRLAVVLNARVFDGPGEPEYRHVVAEHVRNLEALRVSGLAWVGACPAFLTDDPGIGAYEAVLEAPATSSRIAREDLAGFLLDAVETEAFAGHAVGVGSAAA
jgi:putative NADH-flavin reductase